MIAARRRSSRSARPRAVVSRAQPEIAETLPAASAIGDSVIAASHGSSPRRKVLRSR